VATWLVRFGDALNKRLLCCFRSSTGISQLFAYRYSTKLLVNLDIALLHQGLRDFIGPCHSSTSRNLKGAFNNVASHSWLLFLLTFYGLCRSMDHILGGLQNKCRAAVTIDHVSAYPRCGAFAPP